MFNKKQPWQMGASLASIGISVVGMATVVKTKKEIAEAKNSLAQEALHTAQEYPFVSVIVPARNEEKVIEACLTSILEQDYPQFEIVVVDDHSTDQTGTVLARLTQKYKDKVRIVEGLAPQGEWLGKPNALWQGYNSSNAKSEWLLFVDADTWLTPQALRVAVNHALANKLDLLSFAPDIKLPNFWSRTLAVEAGKFYQFAAKNPFHPTNPTRWKQLMPSALSFWRDERLMLKATDTGPLEDVYWKTLNWPAHFEHQGFSTRLIIGFDYVKMTPYEGLEDLWESVSKNMFVVGRKSWLTVAYVVGIEWLYGLLPVGLLAAGLISGKSQSQTARLINLVSIAFLIGLHAELGAMFQVPRRYGLLYPISAVLTSLIMFDSALKVRFRKAVSWKGREVRVD